MEAETITQLIAVGGTFRRCINSCGVTLAKPINH